MQFGKVPNPEKIDFTLPSDHPKTEEILETKEPYRELSVFVGCAKWNKQDLKGFYPRGTKDELIYYAKQFNCIELNATFYRNFSADQFATWYDKTPPDFKFFPKLLRNISHIKRLNEDVQPIVDDYLSNAIHLKEKLGTLFLQMHANFSPKDMNRVKRFVKLWPENIRLAIELRHTDWYNDPKIAEELFSLFEQYNIATVLTDSAGRRDLLHMRLTNNEAFIRYVGTNHPSDYDRLAEWVERLKIWKNQGLKRIHFFVHQNTEKESPLLSGYFIKLLNKELGTDLKIPSQKIDTPTLF